MQTSVLEMIGVWFVTVLAIIGLAITIFLLYLGWGVVSEWLTEYKVLLSRELQNRIDREAKTNHAPVDEKTQEVATV